VKDRTLSSIPPLHQTAAHSCVGVQPTETELGLILRAFPRSCVGAGGCSGGLVSKSTVPPIGGAIYRTRLGRMAFAFTPTTAGYALRLHQLTAPGHPPVEDDIDARLESRRSPTCDPCQLPGFHAPRRGVP
jgi:hypothetical protein